MKTISIYFFFPKDAMFKYISPAFLACMIVAFTAGNTQAAVSYLDNGTIRLGIDLDKGGSITYLGSKTGNTLNLINSHDLGREIQQSYYSRRPPGNPYSTTIWNPIQAGDIHGNSSPVVDWRNTGGELYVKTAPIDWFLDNVSGECTMETWITLNGNIATVHNRLTNQRTDTTQQYNAIFIPQELPAIYTVGTLNRLVSYIGTEPFTGDATTTLVGAPWTAFRATENWAAYVNDSDFGLGVFSPHSVMFGGGFHGTPGYGGPSSDNTGYMSPQKYEIIDSNIVYDYTYKLMVSDLDGIRNYAYLNRPDPRPDYRFNGNRQSWYFYPTGASDNGFPVGNHWHILLDGDDPSLIGPACAFQAEEVPKLYIRAAYNANQPANAQLFWEVNNAGTPLGNDGTARFPKFTPTQSYSFRMINDGKYHTYELDLESVADYDGLITALRFDPAYSGFAGDYMDIQYISYYPVPEIMGDVNYDGIVDEADAAVPAANWLMSSDATWDHGDFNSDGVVDDLDASILAANWGSAAASVPEPGMIALLSGLLLMTRRLK